DAPGTGGSGTGFVIKVDGGAVYLATNHHVINLPPAPGRPPATPTITAVFSSGTKAEQSYRAEVLASDARRDLAVLRCVGVSAPPAAIDMRPGKELVETMPVFIFGFPLGELLATGKGNPAITVGKGTVSSIRKD